MPQKNELPTTLVLEVLSGTMQDRYAECGTLQVHPNYVNTRDFAVYGTPKQTRVAVQAAFLLRWAGVNGRTLESFDENNVVPELVNIKGSEVHYGELELDSTFAMLSTMKFIDSDRDRIFPSNRIRKVFTQYPNQTIAVLPPTGFFAGSLRDGIRAHRLYNRTLYGNDASIPLGKTTSTPAIDARRKELRIVKDQAK